MRNDLFIHDVAAFLGISGSLRAKSFNFLDAHGLNKPEIMVAAAHIRFDAEGHLTDEATQGFLKAMLEALCDWTLPLRGATTVTV